MKNVSKLVAAGLILAVAVCCTKVDEISGTEKQFEKFSINGTAALSAKTALADDGITALWLNGDKLSVFAGDPVVDPANNEFDIVPFVGPGVTSAAFTGEIESESTSFVALYPYDSEATYSDDVIVTTLPSTQEATQSSFANGAALAVGKGSRAAASYFGDAEFTNLCSVIAFTIPSNVTSAKKVTIASKAGIAMAGTVAVNCRNTPFIQSANETSVVLEGDFAGGNTYYATIAPGIYVDGFTFTIENESGSSYVRDNGGVTVNAAAGRIYPIGILSVALSDDEIVPTVSILHNVGDGVLYGSTAKLSIGIASEDLAAAVEGWNITVTLSRDGEVFRTLEYEGTDVKDVEMTSFDGMDYLPAGEFDYEVSGSYFVFNGEKLVERTFSVSGTTTSPAPSGFVIDASVKALTSYEYYNMGEVELANASDGMSIFGFEAFDITGLGFDPAKYASTLKFTPVIDEVEYDAESVPVALGSHEVKLKWELDGVSGTTTGSKTVTVTGLPFTEKFLTGASSRWTVSDSDLVTFGNGHMMMGDSGVDIGSCTSTLKTDNLIYVPEGINTTVNCNVNLKTAQAVFFFTTTFIVTVNGVKIISQESQDDNCSAHLYTFSKESSLKAGVNKIVLENTKSSTARYSKVKMFEILYR